MKKKKSKTIKTYVRLIEVLDSLIIQYEHPHPYNYIAVISEYILNCVIQNNTESLESLLLYIQDQQLTTDSIAEKVGEKRIGFSDIDNNDSDVDDCEDIIKGVEPY